MEHPITGSQTPGMTCKPWPVSLEAGPTETAGTTVACQNTGTASLSVDTPVLADGSSSAFELVLQTEPRGVFAAGCRPGEGDVLMVDVGFTPTCDSPGELMKYGGLLDIAYSWDVGGRSVSDGVMIDLEGTRGLAPHIILVPGELNFGDLSVGAAQSLEVIMINMGDADLDVDSVRFEPAGLPIVADLRIWGVPENGFHIPPDGRETFDVTFAPESVHSWEDAAAVRFVVTSNAPCTPEVEIPINASSH